MLELVLDRRPLRGLSTAPAVLHGDAALSYRELGARIEARAAELALPERSLVALDGERCTEHVVTYLALLWAGHVPILLPEAGGGAVAAQWPITARLTATAGGLRVHRFDDRPPTLHPELALLLPTSGSTGTPKLVRLSARNLASNAAAIAGYLALTDADRAITSLPLHYCYGLSVLHAHLHAGASTVLIEASVVDPCFREAFTGTGVTNLAGVPHTFDLLERGDCEWLATPSLRVLTQAGGRLPAAQVRRWAARAERWGAQLFVMYGQTEATARIAYLPPALACRRPEAIGRAIPGGTLRLRTADGVELEAGPAADGAEGELLYRGPNVMLGYAAAVVDLAAGATLHELATGDLARYHADDDVFELIGRRSRFTKLFGVRLDLDAIEALLRPASPGEVVVLGDDRQLRVVAPGADAAALHELAVQRLGLPWCAVTVRTDVPIARTASGKVDLTALDRAWAAGVPAGPAVIGPGPRTASEPAGAATSALTSVAAVVADVLGRRTVDVDRSFVASGGDSLSYVECSVRLEAMLGPLPADWHHRPLRALAAGSAATGPAATGSVADGSVAGGERPAAAPPGGSPRFAGGRRTAQLDTTIALRAVAVCLVVSYHMGVARTPGGAHLLLAVAGYNFARFVGGIDAPGARLRTAALSCARVAAPAMLWLGAGHLLFGRYEPSMVLLVHNYAGSPGTFFDGHWAYWFFEAFVQLTLGTALLLAIPVVDRLHRRAPYGFPLALFGAAVAARGWWQLPEGWHFSFYRTHSVAFFFVLGWLVHRSDRWRLRLCTAALALLAVPGFFNSPRKELTILLGLAVLWGWRTLTVPRWLVAPVSTVAAASLWIYLTHFELWPRLASWTGSPLLAYGPTVLAGIAAWRLPRALRRRWRAASDRPAQPAPPEQLVQPAPPEQLVQPAPPGRAPEPAAAGR